jgi:prevent-host-death family protein
MAKAYSVYEAKARFSELVRRVREHGDTVVVTYHGEPVAEIRPVVPSTTSTFSARLARLAEQGVLLPAAEASKRRIRRIARKPGALDRFLKERDD